MTGSKTRTGRVRSGGGFLSQNDLRLHFGLGEAAAANGSRSAGPVEGARF